MAKIQTKYGCIEIKPMPREECFSLPGASDAFKRQMEIVDKAYREINNQREQQILQRLSQIGFEFRNDLERQQFTKERLTVVNHIDNIYEKHLYLDYDKPTKMLVAIWDDNVKTSYKDGRFSMTSG